MQLAFGFRLSAFGSSGQRSLVIHFQLVAASGVKFDSEAYEVLVPTEDGTIAVRRRPRTIIAFGGRHDRP